MRPSLSFRSIFVVALLLVGGFAGASSCAPTDPPAPVVVPLDEAVRRTIATGSARLHAELRDQGGATVTVTGVTSLRTPVSAVSAEAPGNPPVEVRSTANGVWLRSRPDAAWTPVPAGTTEAVGAAAGWGDLLGGLRPAPSSGSTGLRATHEGDPVLVDLDARGRIRRLRIDKASAHLDLRLFDHGVAVDVADP